MCDYIIKKRRKNLNDKDKKIIAGILGLSLLLSAVIPTGIAEASSLYNIEVSYRDLEKDFDYQVEQLSEEITKIEVSLGGEKTTAFYDKEDGTVTVDEEVVATFTKVEKKEAKFNTFVCCSFYPTVLNIGTDKGSGTWEVRNSSSWKVEFSKVATTAAIVATLVAAFLDDKPSAKNAAIISAASQLYALLASNTTYEFHFLGKKDIKNRKIRQDSLYIDKYYTSTPLIQINFNYILDVGK